MLLLSLLLSAAGAALEGDKELGAYGFLLGFGIVVAGLVMTGAPDVVRAALFVLGTDGSLDLDSLSGQLAARYSFIDSQESVRELASVIRGKYEASRSQAPEQESVLVTLSEAETRDALAAADLSEQHLRTVVAELQ